MMELGQLLRQTREAKELSLTDVEARTRIRQRYLAALEAGDWNELPNEVVARGFLSTYAGFLGLDAADLLTQFGHNAPRPAPPPSTSPSTVPVEPPPYRPVNLDLFDDGAGRVRLYRRLLRLALLLLLALALGFLLIRFGLPLLLGDAAVLPAPPSATLPPPATAPATPLIVLTGPETPTLEPATIAPPTLSTATAPAATPAPTATATIVASPTAVQQLSLQIAITQRSWLSVLADGKPQFEGILEAGASQVYTATQILQLRTGNAGGVQGTLNGETLPALGEPGDIVEIIWMVENGAVIQATPTPQPEG